MEQVFEIVAGMLRAFIEGQAMAKYFECCGGVAVTAHDGLVMACARRDDHEEHDSGTRVRWPNIAPGDRSRATDRLCYLLPALTDEALAAVLAVAEAAPKRDLSSGTLAEEQRAREENCRACRYEGATLQSIPHTCPESAEVAPIEPCKACACERDGVCNHGSPHTCERLPHDMDAMAESAARSILAPLQDDVDDAARRLGLCVFAEGSVEHQARAVLFEALGKYTGVTPVVALRSALGLVADVENDGDRSVAARHQTARRRSRSYSASLHELKVDGCEIVEGKGGMCLVRWPGGETYPRPVAS